ncbi:MAG: S8 family peptidase [Thermoproteus sp.]
MRHYIVYGSFAPGARIETSTADRGLTTLLSEMGLDALVRLGVEVVDAYGEWGLAVIKATEKEAAELKRYGYRVEEDREVKLSGDLWNLELIGWRGDYPYNGSGVTIAVIDSGVDSGACGLDGKVVGNKDFTGEGEEDLYGHGTHVASIAAGGDVGVARGAKIYNIKAFNKYGFSSDHVVLRAIYYAGTEAQVDVVNMSFGRPGELGDPVARAANWLLSRGRLPVAAAGNSGPKRGTIESPALGEYVIAVGAVGPDKRIAEYSSRGPVDNLIKPDLVAPGGVRGRGVVAARPRKVNPPCPPVGNCHPRLGSRRAPLPNGEGGQAEGHPSRRSCQKPHTPNHRRPRPAARGSRQRPTPPRQSASHHSNPSHRDSCRLNNCHSRRHTHNRHTLSPHEAAAKPPETKLHQPNSRRLQGGADHQGAVNSPLYTRPHHPR